MAQRHIQLFRNGTPSYDATRTKHQDVVNYLLGADSPLKSLTVNDGELVLYRYKLTQDGDIHTIVLAVSFPEGGTKTFEVVANYDHLTKLITELDAEITSSDGKNVNVQVKEVDGKITEVHVTTDNTVNATDLANAINALDGSATVATNADGVVTLYNVNEVDGIISQGDVAVTLAKVAKTGAAEDVSVARIEGITATNVQSALAELQRDITAINNQTITALPDQAVQVTTAENGNTTIGLKLDATEKVLSQTYNNGLKTNLNLTYDSIAKEIRLWGISNTEPIATVDATNFIKDGMLADATIVPGTWAEGEFTESETGNDKAIKLVWNTDAGKDDMYINAETLVDSYTAGNDWIVINQDTNKISHKTIETLTTGTYGIETAVTGTGTYAETKTFKVPQLTVDAAGHVTTVNEKEVSITLPSKQVASDVTINTITGIEATNVQGALAELQGNIDAINGVTWSGDDEIDVDNDTHTIKHTVHTFTPTTSTNGTAVKAVVIPQLTVNAAGHVTAIDNKTFNIDCNVTTVSGTENQIVVTPTEAGEDVNYQVSLATIHPLKGTGVDNYTDDTITHTRISDIEVDEYGRVTKVTKTTVTENFDAGTY